MARNPLDIYKFIQAAASLAKRGVKETDILNAAKREFGEVSDLLKIQIRKIFKDKDAPSIKNPNKQPGEVIEASFKPGMDKRGKVVEESPSQASGIMERIGKASSRIEELMKERDAMYKPKQGLDLLEGLTRTITRKILDRKNIEIPRGSDPIEVFSNTFGDSVGDVRNLAEELIEIDRVGGASGNIDDMIAKDGLFDIEIPQNPSKGLNDEEMLKLKKEVDEEKMLDEFDVTDRDENSMGGINRINLRKGTKVLKLVDFFKSKGTTLAAEIRKAVDNIFASGDSKYDADVAVDSALEEYGVDREMFDEMDIIDAYDEAYQTIVTQRGLASGKIPKDSDIDLTQGMIDLDELNITKDASAAKKAVDDLELDEDVKAAVPKFLERMQLKQKYPGITDDLLDKILIDDNPQRKAEVMAAMDEAFTMMEQGKGPDEVLDIMKKGGKTRKDNAQGGLNYLMGM